MVENKTGLGRGLTSLLGENLSEISLSYNEENKIKSIPVEKIKPGPWQARKKFKLKDLEELSNSIKSKGIINPIIVMSSNELKKGEYYLIAGERRWRAAQIAKVHEIPSIVMKNINLFDASVISLIENIQRQDLNIVEEALGYNDLINKYQYTQEKTAKVVGKSRVYITNTLRLLKLPKKILNYLEDGVISAGHARLMIGRQDSLELAHKTIKDKLSVRDLERLIKTSAVRKIHTEPSDPNIESISKNLTDILGLKVSIKFEKLNVKSKTTIHCNSLDQFNDLIEKLEHFNK